MMEMIVSESEAYFYQNFAAEFGRYDIRDENLHPEYVDSKPHFALTETQYFGFSVPEAEIHGFLYLWYHPHLKVVGAGPMVAKGIKNLSLACELIDYQSYLPEDQLNGGLTGFKLSNGYSVEMLEPGRIFQVRYEDAPRGNLIDLRYTAVSDILMWPGDKHFEQVMKVEGQLKLRGQSYDVGGYNVRDRSWGEARLENSLPGPPIGWMTGVFDEKLAFNVTAFDHPDLEPLWKDDFAVDRAKLFKFGWLILDGERVAVQDARTKTVYDPETMMPTGCEAHVVDVAGREYHFSGQVTAGAPIHPFPNNRAPICLVRWEYEGRTGWGDLQQSQGNDFLMRYLGANRAGG